MSSISEVDAGVSTRVPSFPIFASFLSPRYPKTRPERLIFLVILIISGIILVALLLFYIANPRSVIGDSLVNAANGTPMEIPPPSVFSFYTKPVTIMFVAIVAFAYCFFSLAQSLFAKLPRSLVSFLLIVSTVLFAMFTYETLYNFALWTSLLVGGSNPDSLVNSFPVGSVRINLVFSTKSFVALMFVSYFSISAFRSSLET